MAGNPREHVKDQGFWDGGAPGQGTNEESAGRPNGSPATSNPRRVGIRTDIEFPPEDPVKPQDRRI
jgi:hypothetical protein